MYIVTMMSSPHRTDVAQALSTKAFAMKNMTKLNNTVRYTLYGYRDLKPLTIAILSLVIY